MTAQATWNQTTIGGVDYLIIDTAQFRIPLEWDPNSGFFIAVGTPVGGFGSFPALVKGDTGPAPALDSVIDLTVLDAADPTADSAGLTPIGTTDDGGPIYQVGLTIHQGGKGDPGTSVLDPTAYGTPLSGRIIVVNSGADGFVYQPQLVGDRFVPATINSAPAGNPTYTLCSVSVPAQPFDWRPDVSGQAIIATTGTHNAVVDLVARLNNESAGNIVGRRFGVSSTVGQNVALVPGPPAGSVDTYDRVSAGASAVVYLRGERQSGTDTFTTSASTTSFRVRVNPVPPGA